MSSDVPPKAPKSPILKAAEATLSVPDVNDGLLGVRATTGLSSITIVFTVGIAFGFSIAVFIFDFKDVGEWQFPPRASSMFAWLPSWEQFWKEFWTPLVEFDLDPATTPESVYGDPKLRQVFDAWAATQWFYDHWEIPLTTCACYLLGIPTLRWYMSSRKRVEARNAVAAWNLFLSVFSATGLFFTAPTLLHKIFSESFHASVCAAPFEYGHGMCGFFVAAFIASKLFETVDTFFLLIRQSNVILLHWYHHATVMLYCWHAYSIRTGFAGLWFAVMNYFVHTLMYFYYAMTQYSKATRAMVKPFDILITTLQILQMVMGMMVLVKTAVVQMAGGECFMNRSNQILGLVMYTSYFVLFAKLFLEYYVFGGKQKRDAARDAARSAKVKSVLKEVGKDAEFNKLD